MSEPLCSGRALTATATSTRREPPCRAWNEQHTEGSCQFKCIEHQKSAPNQGFKLVRHISTQPNEIACHF